jgi:hypothetical protein
VANDNGRYQFSFYVGCATFYSYCSLLHEMRTSLDLFKQRAQPQRFGTKEYDTHHFCGLDSL